MSKEKIEEFLKQTPDFIKKNPSDYFFAMPKSYYDSISIEVVNNKLNNLELYVYDYNIIPEGYLLISKKSDFDDTLKKLASKSIQ